MAWAITDGGPGVGVVRKPTKRSDWRDVPLTLAAVAALQHQGARRLELLQAEPAGDSYVFPGGIDPGVAMRPERLQNRWAAARGPSPVTLGHFRHFAATAMLDAGESYRTVADILGNSESTLRLHYDATDVGKRKAIAALELGREMAATPEANSCLVLDGGTNGVASKGRLAAPSGLPGNHSSRLSTYGPVALLAWVRPKVVGERDGHAPP